MPSRGRELGAAKKIEVEDGEDRKIRGGKDRRNAEEIDLKPVQSFGRGCRLVNFSAATEMRLTNEALSRND